MSWRVRYSADEAWQGPRADLYPAIHFSCRMILLPRRNLRFGAGFLLSYLPMDGPEPR